MKLLGKIRTSDWNNAKRFFNKPDNKNKIKCSKKDNPYYETSTQPERFYSFIKINNKIYAMANHQYLGKGEFGAVKIVQNQKGENFAIKIEEINLEGDLDLDQENRKIELKILSKIKDPNNQKYLKGHAECNGKRYTITSLIRGQDLSKHPQISHYTFDKKTQEHQFNPCTMRYLKKLQVALHTTKALKIIHDNGILHGDFKPSNLMYFEVKDKIKIYPVDYGMSFLLKKNNLVAKMKGKKRRTPPLERRICAPLYRAPEIAEGNRITKTCDIYSLGVIFKHDLELPLETYERLLDVEDWNRPNCNQIIKSLKAEIKRVTKRARLGGNNIARLMSQIIPNDSISYDFSNEQNILKCKFNFKGNQNIEFAYFAAKIIFNKLDISYHEIDFGTLHIALDENHDYFTNEEKLLEMKYELQTQIDKMNIISNLFERINLINESIKTLSSELEVFRSISKKDIQSIYEYLLDNRIEIEEDLWECQSGEVLPIWVPLRSKSNVFIRQYESHFHLVAAENRQHASSNTYWKLDEHFPTSFSDRRFNSVFIDDEQPPIGMPLLFSSQAIIRSQSAFFKDIHSQAACSSSSTSLPFATLTKSTAFENYHEFIQQNSQNQDSNILTDDDEHVSSRAYSSLRSLGN